MSGYSQGAQVVHIAASMLSNDTMSKVASVVLFGVRSPPLTSPPLHDTTSNLLSPGI